MKAAVESMDEQGHRVYEMALMMIILRSVESFQLHIARAYHFTQANFTE